MAAVGTVGVWLCIQDVRTGARLKDILFANRGFYLLSPLLVACGALRLAGLIRSLKNGNAK